ncbi:MAG: hypothetical protein ACO1NS_02510 [Daejeonella sp.]
MEEQRYIELLAEISNNLKRVVQLLEDGQSGLPASERKWIDRLEVEELLNRSESTIKRHTKKGILVARRIGSQNMYWKPDVFRMIEKYLK